ncbi:hypothetical protein HN832_00530 [archaeon]|jgi:hypothetical protein|nr:hypothetical protein [archaeon]MBT7128156.1 hypothetical protein [archaeon]MBT7281879.1 hypothetical protein [archaeon]
MSSKKQNDNTWKIIAGVAVGALVLVLIFFSLGNFNNSSSEKEQEENSFTYECKFALINGQFGGTTGEDAIICKFRNEGNEPAEACFNVQEVKIDGAVETIIAEYKNICSGVVDSWTYSKTSTSYNPWSEEKYIYEPQTYRVFEDEDCWAIGKNADSWDCNMEGSEREIQYIIRAEQIS